MGLSIKFRPTIDSFFFLNKKKCAKDEKEDKRLGLLSGVCLL